MNEGITVIIVCLCCLKYIYLYKSNTSGGITVIIFSKLHEWQYHGDNCVLSNEEDAAVL